MYWATFTESLRDESSAYNPKPLKLTLVRQSLGTGAPNARGPKPRLNLYVNPRHMVFLEGAIICYSHALSALARLFYYRS